MSERVASNRETTGRPRRGCDQRAGLENPYIADTLESRVISPQTSKNDVDLWEIMNTYVHHSSQLRRILRQRGSIHEIYNFMMRDDAP